VSNTNPELSDDRIVDLVDKHVGGPTPSYPLDMSDWINFARAVIYADRALLADRERQAGEAVAWREALLTARDHIDMDALRISHRKDAAAIDAAIASLPAPQAVQAGWKLVPLEPTPKMWTAGGRAIKECGGHERDAASLAYVAMISAAPSPDGKAEQAEAPSDKLRQIYEALLSGYFYMDYDKATEMIGWLRKHLAATQPTASNAGERFAQRLTNARNLVDRGMWVEGARILDELIAALASKPPAGEQKPDMRAICEALGFDPTNHHNAAKCPYCRPVQPEQVAQDSAVLAYLDDLKDDAIAHIWPDDLERCQTSECVVEVTSVRMGSPDGKTVPLFSREQVAEALRAARARGEGRDRS